MALALYRRYRPDTFDGVIGQKQVTVPLSRALDQGKLTHAYLFSGPRGCGKTSSARIFARCINCAKGPTSHPCGECESCQDLATGGPGSIDVVEIDAASHNGVDDARELRERAGFAPVRDRYKIFILDEAHMVTQQGFNALLKIVEEPPEHVMFIFATTEPEKVISTIRSRTHHYPFRLVPQEVMGPYLEQICKDEKIEAEPGVLKLAMRAGGGSVRDTLSVLDQLMVGSDQGTISYDSAVALLGYTPEALIGEAIDAVSEQDGPKLYGVIQKVVVGGFEPKRFVEDLLQRVRDLLVLLLAGQSAESTLSEDAEAENVDDLQRQAHAFGLGKLTRIADIINDALASMTGATSPRMRLELLAARLLVPDSELAPAIGQVAGAGAGRNATGPAGAGAGAGQGGFIGARHPGNTAGPAAANNVQSQPNVAQGGPAPLARPTGTTGAGPASQVGAPESAPAPAQQAHQAQPAAGPSEQAVPVQSGPANAASAAAAESSSAQVEQARGQAAEQTASNGHEGMSVDQRWDAVVQALPEGVKEYVARDKVPSVALEQNAKGRPVLAMTFDQPLSQHAFALAVASRAIDGETKVPKIVMVRARQEFGAETMIAPSGVAANGEQVESVARMSPERRSEVKKQIALARMNMSAMNLGAGVTPHTASAPGNKGNESSQARAHSSQKSGAGRDGAEAAEDAADTDSDAHHPARAQAAQGQSDQAPTAQSQAVQSQPAQVVGSDTSGSVESRENQDISGGTQQTRPAPSSTASGAEKPTPGGSSAGADASVGGPAQESSPLPAAGFASTESYVKPDELDDNDPWAHPQPPTVDLGPGKQTAGQGHDAQEPEQVERADEDRKLKKMGLPDLSDQDDPWAVPPSQVSSPPAGEPSSEGQSDQLAGAVNDSGDVISSSAAAPSPSAGLPEQASVQGDAGSDAPIADSPASAPALGHNGGFASANQLPAQPEVPAEEDSYSLDDARQGQDSLVDPKELAQMFDVKRVDDLAADDPKNPLNANKRKRQQGFDD
ncbi:DNA polymerase III, subunit gamma and tau [Bombiscardovia nodaiensis]|uniref:DNA-directed DNA polymerase n=1 Tax=Bombiscardovia nodaiensis TaxID=2932181 RepID=A0ABM8BA41_9BIFI|nr:DNA polymerase III, subunit gamma and tau [Bombiscardovia nodaiensis]